MDINQIQSTNFPTYDLPDELKRSVLAEVIQAVPPAQRYQLLAALQDTKAMRCFMQDIKFPELRNITAPDQIKSLAMQEMQNAVAPIAFNDNGTLSNFAKRVIAGSPLSSARDLDTLAKTEPGCRLAIAGNPNTSAKTLAFLLTQTCESPGYAPSPFKAAQRAAENLNTPAEAFEHPSAQRHQICLDIRRAGDPTISASDLVEIASKHLGDDSYPDLKNINDFHLEERDELDILSKNVKNLKTALAGNTMTPVHILKDLAREKSTETKVALICNQSTPVNLLNQIPLESFEVKIALAKNPNTPEHILEQLLNSEGSFVVIQPLVQNSQMPLEALLSLINSETSEDKLWMIASKTPAPAEILALWAQSEESAVRRGVSQNPSTPKEVLYNLAKDPDSTVREYLVYNLETPGELLAELANQKQSSITEHLAYHKNTPRQTLEKLANHSNNSVKNGVAQNESTPPHVLESLGQLASSATDEPLNEIAVSLAKNRKTPAATLKLLAMNGSQHVAIALARHSGTPPEVLQQLAQRDDWALVTHVAVNPNTPLSTLVDLAQNYPHLVHRGLEKNTTIQFALGILHTRFTTPEPQITVSLDPRSPQ